MDCNKLYLGGYILHWQASNLVKCVVSTAMRSRISKVNLKRIMHTKAVSMPVILAAPWCPQYTVAYDIHLHTYRQGRRTLFPVRGFNTRTFSAVFPQFCTNALQHSLLRFSGRSVSGSALAAAASSPLPLKHDTGFECDRLMIGCSALSPASLGVLDLSVSSCWEGGNLWL